jgi:predicted nucleic acid-binding Zn ribbon protein
VFEVLEKFSDTPLEVHQGCGGPVERLLSASAFQFKGTGFYITDYAKKNSSNSNGNGKAAKSESGSKDTATPAKPPETKPSASSEAPAKN